MTDLRVAGPQAATTFTELGDFTTQRRVVYISALAIVIGSICAFIALALLRLIGLLTNLFFMQRFDTTLVSPADSNLGIGIVLVPVIGGLLVGMMARFGSERIRGHGIPEAIEAILINGSRVEPKVAALKPVSAAISIGSGGPFGAEGPIIMTGGAVGSLVAQFFHLTSAERKTLLVAGAAGGMSATFDAPVASVLLATELLLFEWKPRSIVPVAAASAAAALLRVYIIDPGPVFPVPEHDAFIGTAGLLACVGVGLVAGLAAIILTSAVYLAEDSFGRLPIHWMWWPAIGGLIIGIGGLIFPEALGVGYGEISDLLSGHATSRIILGILIVKSFIWAGSLGSGTSGGVLAPLLMIGGAIGALEAGLLPSFGDGFWPMLSMGAILAGTMRSPFTGIVFVLELTHDVNALLPLLIVAMVAYGLTVVVLKRSILTEKVARRGYHLGREYSVDPLEIIFVREVMHTGVTALHADQRLGELAGNLHHENGRPPHLYPVADESGAVVGVITRHELAQAIEAFRNGGTPTIAGAMHSQPVVAHQDEPLRVVAHRMAATGLTCFPVVSADDMVLQGMVSLDDLLKGRIQNLEAERRRERIFKLPAFWTWSGRDSTLS